MAKEFVRDFYGRILGSLENDGSRIAKANSENN